MLIGSPANFVGNNSRRVAAVPFALPSASLVELLQRLLSLLRAAPIPRVACASPARPRNKEAANGDLTRFGLNPPDHKVLESHPIVNSQILHYLSHGDLIAKPNVGRYC